MSGSNGRQRKREQMAMRRKMRFSGPIPTRPQPQQARIACPGCGGKGKVFVKTTTSIILPGMAVKKLERCPLCMGQKFMWLSKDPIL